MINKVIDLFRKIYIEAIIILLLVLCANVILGNPKNIIYSDGKGYYEYLPSIFIFKDINRKDVPLNDSSILYQRIKSKKHYNDYNGYKVNKYSCGTALLQAPFFLITYSTFDLSHTYDDGYQPIFHKAIYISALFYLFIALYFLKALLQLYEIENRIIIFAQLVLVFSTSVIVYTTVDASFSHIYSLCAINVFLYVIKKYFLYKDKKLIFVACALLGLILLLRQVNFLVLLFLPFLAGTAKNLKETFISFYKDVPTVLLAIVCVVAVFSIQLIFWYLQTGDFILYSYKGESFDFTDPQFINILFSYKKGLFVYAPIFLLSIVAIAWMIYKRFYYMALTWLAGFLLLTYVLCSWGSWFYGGSYGLRAYLDYYALFLIPLAIFVQQLSTRLKICVLIFSVCTVVINIIQTYQYKEHILHPQKMDKEGYWKVFLKTDGKYKYFLWNRMISDTEYKLVKEYQIQEKVVHKEIFRKSLDEISNIENVDLIQLTMEDDFDINNEARIELSIIDTASGKSVYFNSPLILHFAQQGFNRRQVGVYNFNITRDYKKHSLNGGQELILNTELPKGKILKNFYIRFYMLNELDEKK